MSDVEVGVAVMDAAGNKVAERVNDVWRFAVYDAFGRLVADYGGQTATDEGGVKFVQQDIQGSTRCVTSISGSVLARMDYQAFGEQIPSNIGQRTAIGFSNADSIRHRYALTENDTATGLNDTWFRKHENRSGRWTSPDPYNGSMSLADPQSFNRNSYVQNDPINFIDPSGLRIAVYKCDYTMISFFGGNGEPRNCRWVYIDIGNGPTTTGGGEGGGPPIVDETVSNDDDAAKTERCKGYIAKAAKALKGFLDEWNKYDPNTDAVGGVQTRWGVTKPHGHWQEMKQFQNTMNRMIAAYDRECNDRNDGRGGRGGGLPDGVRSAATRHIPRVDLNQNLFSPPTREQIRQGIQSAGRTATTGAYVLIIVAGIAIWVLVN